MQQSSQQQIVTSGPAAQEESKDASQTQVDQSVVLVPKFIAGLKTEVKDNIFYLDEHEVIYPAGHNVVFFNLDDKTQRYISGIEGTEGITALALTKSKKFLAVAERNEKAPIVCIYDTQTLKVKKRIISDQMDQKDVKEFISIAFAPTKEQHLITLTNAPAQLVYIWQWDKARYLAQQIIQGNVIGTQVSFSNTDHSVALVTGNSAFRFLKHSPESQQLKTVSQTLSKKEAHISNNYTCHCWLPEGKFLIGTDQGEILLCDGNGELKMDLKESPGEGFYIETIRAYSKGFIIAGDKGQIMIYEKHDEPRTQYARVSSLPNQVNDKTDKDTVHLLAQVVASRIKSIDIAQGEDCIIFTTDSKQLIKMQINLENKTDDIVYDYLVFPFHSRSINGMDTCIKKNLVATCSMDKTVKIWSFIQGTFNLEINQVFNDEAFCVAFHPAGFQIVVGFADSIRMMNIFEKNLVSYKTINIKSCREIVFSNGGHLFACQNQSNICVYKFYTAENPINYVFKKHHGIIRSIDWLEDDTGFISSGWDASIYFWKLNDQEPQWVFKKKNVEFTCVTSFKAEGPQEHEPYIYVSGTDRTIRELKGIDKEKSKDSQLPEGRSIKGIEQSSNVSQIQIMHNRRAIFASVDETNRPGSIQVIRGDLSQKVFEIQAHSLPVERLRLSYDNQTLYSASTDGSLCIFAIQEKDPKKKNTDLPTIQYSNEILIQKMQRDKIQSDIMTLKAAIKQENINKMYEMDMLRQKYDRKQQELQKQIDEKRTTNKQQYENLEAAKSEMERNYGEKFNQMNEDHKDKLLQRAAEQEEKEEADNQRFMDLQQEMDQQLKRFEAIMTEVYMEHHNLMEKMSRDFELEKDGLETEKKQLSADIEKMIIRHKDQRQKVENEKWEEIEAIKEKNKQELADKIDKGMHEKASLTLIQNDHRDKNAQKLGFQNRINQMQEKLNTELNDQANKRQLQKSQKGELNERDTTIADKEKKITELYKKTQELEKFKFVLDYKIKELKREIGPRETAIQQLNEQTTKMNQEVKHFHRMTKNLELIVSDLQLRQDGLTSESQKLQEYTDKQEGYKRQFKEDIHDCLNHLGDYKKLKKGIVHLHKIYVKEEGGKNEIGDSDIHQKQQQLRKQKEISLDNLRENLKKDQDSHKQENSLIMKENVQLLIDINELRKRRHSIKIALNKKLVKIRRIDTIINNGGVQQNKLSPEEAELKRAVDAQGQTQVYEHLSQEIDDYDRDIQDAQQELSQFHHHIQMLEQTKLQRHQLQQQDAAQYQQQQQQMQQDAAIAEQQKAQQDAEAPAQQPTEAKQNPAEGSAAAAGADNQEAQPAQDQRPEAEAVEAESPAQDAEKAAVDGEKQAME